MTIWLPVSLASVLLVQSAASPPSPSRPDFAGTWRLDPSRSESAASSDSAEPRFVEIIHRIMGPLAQLKKSPWAPFDGGAEAWYRYSYANHAGGTPQVKRMVLATRGLGLPR